MAQKYTLETGFNIANTLPKWSPSGISASPSAVNWQNIWRR